MSPRSNMLQKSESPMLEILEGRDKGKIFDILADRISLGRNEDNDIILSSDAVSRNHAVMERNSTGLWYIRDNGSRNGIMVNGQRADHVPLQNGDLVQVGDYTFRFRDMLAQEGDQGFAAPEMEMPQLAAPTAAAPNRRILLYAGVGLVLGAVFYLNGGNGESKEGATEEQTQAKVEAKAEDDLLKQGRSLKMEAPPNLEEKKVEGRNPVAIEDPLLKKEQTELANIDMTNSALRESEQFYKKGQRELLSHNYTRAIESFQTSLSFNRNHELAGKYLRMAVAESEMSAKKNMAIAIKYFESLQYQRAMFHFGEVIALLQHRPTEPMVSQSQAYIELCKRKLQAVELFP